MKTPRITAVMPCYNASWCIERALDSLLAQTRPLDEILVADDGSNDDTRDRVARRYGDRVTVIARPHRGAPSARRAAIAHAHGEWIAFADADDWWIPEKIERQLEFLERHPEVKWFSSDGVYLSSEGVIRESWLSDYFDPLHDQVGDLWFPLARRCFPLTSSMLMDRAAYYDVGGTDTTLTHSDDYDLWLRLAARYPGGIQAERLVAYYCTPGSLTKQTESSKTNLVRILRKILRSPKGRDPVVRSLIAERLASVEFDLGVRSVRSGRFEEGRSLFWRAAAAGPWTRRTVARLVAILPAWATISLARRDWVRHTVTSPKLQVFGGSSPREAESA